MAFKLFAIGLVEEIAFNSYTSSTNNILKQFLEDNGGIPLTCCPHQNPLCSPPSLPLLRLLAPLLPLHLRRRILLCEALLFFKVHESDIESSWALGARVPSFATTKAHKTRCILVSRRCRSSYECGRYPGWSQSIQNGRRKAQSCWDQSRRSWWGLSEHTGGVQRCWGNPRIRPKRFVGNTIFVA
jgi:hypothetical protein